MTIEAATEFGSALECTSRIRGRATLHQNPFWILGATPRDSKQRIGELAEERSLIVDAAACQKARSDLINPRTRLSAEVSWLIGVSPARAAQLVDQLHQGNFDVKVLAGLPPLAHANLLAALFEMLDAETTPGTVAKLINVLACLTDEIKVEDALRDINEDRAVAMFAPVPGPDRLESELTTRRGYFLSAINGALDKLPASFLVQTMTMAAESATADGQRHAPMLIDELVDSYEVKTTPILAQEAENVRKLINSAEVAAKTGEAAIKPVIAQIEVVARNWDQIAQPIQLIAKARGVEHEQSSKLAYEIRDCAAFLSREFGMLDQTKRLIALVQDIFKELPEFSESIERDAQTVDELVATRAASAADHDQWCKDITYRVDLGLLSKDTLWISPDGVCWKKRWYPLDAVTRVRWGGIRHSVNGIPTGTTYTIAFGDDRSETVVELKREDVYSAFTDKLWKAVCGRLLTEMLEKLKRGSEIRIGSAIVQDTRVQLIKHKFFSEEPALFPWSGVKVWNQGGSFYIASQQDTKTYVALSYINVPNVHILEQAIRIMFKESNAQKLSDLLG